MWLEERPAQARGGAGPITDRRLTHGDLSRRAAGDDGLMRPVRRGRFARASLMIAARRRSCECRSNSDGGRGAIGGVSLIKMVRTESALLAVKAGAVLPVKRRKKTNRIHGRRRHGTSPSCFRSWGHACMRVRGATAGTSWMGGMEPKRRRRTSHNDCLYHRARRPFVDTRERSTSGTGTWYEVLTRPDDWRRGTTREAHRASQRRRRGEPTLSLQLGGLLADSIRLFFSRASVYVRRDGRAGCRD